mgnify:CR=1 FL=1
MTAIEFNTQITFLSNKLRYFALKLTSDMEDANDLLQDTILKALTFRNKFTDKTNLSAWMHTIMKNTFINNYRRQQRSGQLFDNTKDLFYLNMPQESGFSSPSSQLYEKEITSGINKLEDQYRVPFMMHVEGYKYEEIAEQLHIPMGTVKSRIFIARKILMEYFKDYRTN